MNDPAANAKRHNMLKLIPSVPQGSWIIKQAVGSTPVLLGNKIGTTYHRYASCSHTFPLNLVMIGNLHCITLSHGDSQAQSDALPPIEASALDTQFPLLHAQ